MSSYEIGVRAEKKMIDEIMRELQLGSIYDINLIRDVCYKGLKGMYEQIDAVLVCERGIFCIEFKNWTGEVTPSSNELWNLIRPNGCVQKLKSPILQNLRHVKVLTRIMENNLSWFKDRRLPIHNVIVFDNKTRIVDSYYDNVMNSSAVSRYVSKINDKLRPEEVYEISRFLVHMVETNRWHFQKQHAQIINKAEQLSKLRRS